MFCIANEYFAKRSGELNPNESCKSSIAKVEKCRLPYFFGACDIIGLVLTGMLFNILSMICLAHF